MQQRVGSAAPRFLSWQDGAEMGGRGSILARQKRDHARLNTLLQQLDAATADRQRTVLLDIYRLVFPHAFAEETVLWPLMRRVLSDGDVLTLHVEMEHQQINELVTAMEALELGSPEHGLVLSRVVCLLREDVRDEEDVLLPRLQERLTSGQLHVLGIVWEIVRAIAPTRAHPIVARRPPGNVLSALPLAVLDRCRDLLDARRQDDVAAPAWKKLSAILTDTAHRVERLPGMRRGEDPATRAGGRSGSGWLAAALIIGAGSAAMMLASRRLYRR